MRNIKQFTIYSAVTFIGGFIGTVITSFTKIDLSIKLLILAMIIDYITGLIVAYVFKKSPKSKTGSFNSKYAFRGICKKFVIIFLVALCKGLGSYLNLDFLEQGVAIAYLVNEIASIFENCGLMGIPIPNKLKECLEVLRNKEEK